MTETPEFATRFVNLASPKMGTEAVACSDDFFAPMARMLQDHDPVWIPDKYDDRGKWMDGWESRRKRTPGHDWCLIRLGVPGIVRGVDIDTAHFTGNYPPEAMLEGCRSETEPGSGAEWTTLVPRCALGSSCNNFAASANGMPVNWLRLNIYPDGGVARLRVYGEPVVDWDAVADDGAVELSSLKNGGRIVGYNDAHYGDVTALLSAGRGKTMGDGWETRRRREPGHDWIVIALGHRGIVERIEVDTAHFKGNFPDRCSVQGAVAGASGDGNGDEALLDAAGGWAFLLEQNRLEAESIHVFEAADLASAGPVDTVRLNIYPDGGVSRFRVLGRLDRG